MNGKFTNDSAKAPARVVNLAIGRADRRVSPMLHALITPHDEFQDGILLFVLLMVVVNDVILVKHLQDHKTWRETEEPSRKRTGALH